jgi:hypothetical protein
MTMGELTNWAKANSKFIKLADGEKFTGKYLGYQKGSFRGTPLIEYKFEITGEAKIFSSGSNKLATRMDNVDKGKIVTVKRFGEGYETNYEVEIEGQPKEEPKDETVINPEESEAWDG